MTSGLRNNLRQIKEIVRELYVFSNQLEAINNAEANSKVVMNRNEKELLEFTIVSLTNQLKILNNAIPSLLNMSSFYKSLPGQQNLQEQAAQIQPLSKVTYQPSPEKQPVSLVISESEKQAFIENLSKSRLSINMLKKKYVTEATLGGGIQKPSFYAKLSNTFFRKFSNNLISKGHFSDLNKSLRKINSRFVVGSYVSMIFFTGFLAFIFALFLFIVLLFFNVSIIFPNILTPVEFSFLRLLKVIWVIPLLPAFVGFLFYIFPFSESKNLGGKIDQELPFITIHMSAIASSGVEPTNIFKIILKSGEYKYTSIEIKKLMNLINFHGADMVTALKKISISSSSMKLKELLNGLAVTITSGGNLHDYLNKHAETMLFDYKLEREKYNKISETFMDIYISIAIAAPMIMLMIFVIIGSTGLMGNIFGLSTKALSVLMIMGIVLLNIFFLIFLRLKQPVL